MDEYVKLKDALIAFANYIGPRNERTVNALYSILPIPKADVRKNVHGEWVRWARSDECSVCGYKTGRYEMGSNFCPNCGADMRQRR